MNKFIQFTKDDSGATIIEYALLAALIAIAVIATLTTLGQNIDAAFQSISTAVSSSSSQPA